MRLHLLVEGQTEEVMCNRLFIPHLQACGWRSVTASILSTKRVAAGGNFKGGVSSWGQVKRELSRLLPCFDRVTTVIDYYGFPADGPGMPDRPVGSASDRVRHVEHALAADVQDARFIPHLTLHETESWVFAAADALAELVGDAAVAGDLRATAQQAGGVELINDAPETAPSKRLLQRLPTYAKTIHGPLCVETLGLTELRRQCPHLDAWLGGLELET